MQTLWSLADQAFLPAAVLAHLSVSVLGGWTIIKRVVAVDSTAPALTDPSVILFLLAGAITALLLLQVSEPQTAKAKSPVHVQTEILALRRERAAPIFATSGIEIAPTQRFAHSDPQPDDPKFDGLMNHVSHELRTPLNAIIGFAELMQRELLGPLGPRYHEYARHIRESGYAVLKAAESTMALTTLLADRERTQAAPIDLDSMVSEACLQSGARERGIRIVRGAPSNASVYAEPNALKQALGNLISAAVLRAPERRPISIITRVVSGAVRLVIVFGAPGDEGRTAETQQSAQSAPAPTQLSVAVAKMLLDLQQVHLMESRGRDGMRRMTAELPLAQLAEPAHHAIHARAFAHPAGIYRRALRV
jgi:signal transduction histidine kinase